MKTREGRQAALLFRTPFLATAVRRIWKCTDVEDTFSVLSMRSVYKCVTIWLTFRNIYITNQLVGQKEYRVDNGLVAICTCRCLLKTAKLPRIDYICSFTVDRPVHIYFDVLRKSWVLLIDNRKVHDQAPSRLLPKVPPRWSRRRSLDLGVGEAPSSLSCLA